MIVWYASTIARRLADEPPRFPANGTLGNDGSPRFTGTQSGLPRLCSFARSRRHITLPSWVAWYGGSRSTSTGSQRWSATSADSRSISPNSHCCHARSEEHTSELQSLRHLVCRLL